MFLQNHSKEVEDQFSYNGKSRMWNASLFSTPVSDGILGNADSYFDKIDTDHSGTISFKELSNFAKEKKNIHPYDAKEEEYDRYVAEFALSAYNYDMVPDNPRNVLEKKEKINPAEFGL